MPAKRITFKGHNGDDLAARLDLPEGPVLACAIFAHCFTCSKDILAAKRIAARLSSMALAVLRFDFTGLGHSEGEFANTNFTSNVQDLVQAAKFLDSEGYSPDLLIGHSLGGAAVIKAAPEIASAKAVVTIGAPFAPAHVALNFGDAIGAIETRGEAEVDLGGRPFVIKKQFLDDIRDNSLYDTLRDLKKALLVLHAPLDRTVGIENAERIFVAARHPKSFVSLDQADHLITRKEDAEYISEVIAAWMQNYVEFPEQTGTAQAPEGVVRVSEADPAGFLQDVQSGPHHHALADEPLSFGGTNRGMTPYGFLSAGLGACTSMTIRMHARRKNIALTHVSVDVMHDKAHLPDMQGKGEKVDHFRRIIHLEGDLSQEERAKLLQIADRCPVHRTLERKSEIITELA